MPAFSLTEDTVNRLQSKFKEFLEARKRIHELITSYVIDYRQFNGNPDYRKEFLEEKYSPIVPNFSYLVAYDNQIFFNVSDIALLLGRTQPAISITLLNMEESEG